jgi:hypothetical protein
MKMFEVEVELGDELAIGGLSVFPLTGRGEAGPAYLTGPEAFEAGMIQVSELDPPQVPSLAIFNLALVPILLVEGEMLVGGDQNRTMNVTVLCPPQVQTVVPVSCVEAGRWGKRRTVSASSKHAPGSLRAAKTAKLESMSADLSSRRSDQGLIWHEVERQSRAHEVFSETSALDDVQEQVEDRLAPEFEKIRTVPGQIGVICTIGEQVVGVDLFDKPSTLERYLRSIVAGHALDAPSRSSGGDPIRAIERFLAQIDGTACETGPGVGVGEEVLLRGEVAGIGLLYDDFLVHLAAFPVPDELVEAG